VEPDRRTDRRIGSEVGMIKRTLLLALVASMVLGVTGATPAMAKDGDVVRSGSCSGSTDWKLKLSPEDGRIEVEYEVDSNRVGQTWKVRIAKDGDRIFGGKRTTSGPSGSFEVRVVTSNTAGDDVFKARAKNPATGEVCRGSATF
jgi:hypothetical protein